MSKTVLKDRTLYYDGDTEISPDRIVEFLDKGLRDVFVTELTEEIQEFNRYGSTKITTKDKVRPLSFEWNIPEPYKSLDVEEYVEDKMDEVIYEQFGGKLGGPNITTRVHRTYDELDLYKELDLIPILRAIIYVINTLQDNKIVWGVGRGSSVSSYVLYLLGVHDVDSVKYNLDIADFLRRPE